MNFLMGLSPVRGQLRAPRSGQDMGQMGRDLILPGEFECLTVTRLSAQTLCRAGAIFYARVGDSRTQ